MFNGASPMATYADIIERIGCGWAQLRISFLVGGIWFSDGALILATAATTNVLLDKWDLTGTERGAIFAVIFIGITAGNLLGGHLGDSLGRRPPICLAYLSIVVSASAASYANNFSTLFVSRLVLGVALGIGQPAVNCFLVETTPAYWRLCVCGLSALQFISGEIFGSVVVSIDDPTLQNLQWRWLLRVLSIPAAFLGLCALACFPESPLWCAMNGRYDEAKMILCDMQNINGSGDFEVDFQRSGLEALSDRCVEGRSLGGSMNIIFGQKYVLTTAITTLSCFVLNLTYYGCIYAFPQILPSLGLTGTPAQGLIMGALWEVPGVVFGLFLGTLMERKLHLKIYLFFNTSCLMALAFALPIHDHSVFVSACLYYGYYGIKFVTSFGWLVTYQYTAEVFPTQCRTTAASLCMAGGRAGVMLAPMVFEMSVRKTLGFSCFFSFLALMTTFNLFVIDFLPYETYGTAVDRHDASELSTRRNTDGYGVA